MRARALIVAFSIALAVGASCVLPEYEVADSSSGSATAGGGTSSMSGGLGGAGASGASTSSTNTTSVGVGGGEVGGSGIGGQASCTGTNGGTLVTLDPSPHGIAASDSWVFWIAGSDNHLRYAPQKSTDVATLSGATGICGLAANGEDDNEALAARDENGQVWVGHGSASTPFSDYKSVYMPTAPGTLYGEGSCAISLSSDGTSLYGFELVGGSYELALYPLDGSGVELLGPMMSRPIAINAINDTTVAWIEGASGTTMIEYMKKTTKHVTAGALAAVTDVCAFGPSSKFGFTEPSYGIVYSSPGAATLTNYATMIAADRIACNVERRVWIVPGPDGCNDVQGNHSAKDMPGPPFAPRQPRACSVAISQNKDEVYWTNCEPDGAVYRAKAP